MKGNRRAAAAAALLLAVTVCAGCGQEMIDGINGLVASEPAEGTSEGSPPEAVRDLPPVPPESFPVPFDVALPEAAGAAVEQNDKAAIDYSNTADGYVMARYPDDPGLSLKVRVEGPGGSQYDYNLAPGEYEAFPLSEGDGSYTVGVYEQVGGTRYALAVSVTAEVSLKDQFAPFVRPNQFVNYDGKSDAVRMAAALGGEAPALLDKVAGVYHYVTEALDYDKELAATVRAGYLPDVDTVLARGKGICFDYASLMAAMLRCQGIPAKLVVGYAGDAYHAWLSVYSAEEGWIDGVIHFDGASWQLMDPTFADGGSDEELREYIGDGANYTPEFQY